MKILFVENRYATWIYAHVAKNLAMLGHEIHWLVQNPMFKPDFGVSYIIPFPRVNSKQSATDSYYSELAKTDRGVIHFGGSKAHYPHYDTQIGAYLSRLQPDVIFGEATAFHELLTIRHARALGILYLCPNATRYPSDRLTFLAYDTLQPVGGDGSILDLCQLDEMLNGIRQRKIVPSYMRPAAVNQGPTQLFLLREKLRIMLGRIRGERYNTPSPKCKFDLNAAQRAARAHWEINAAGRLPQWSKLLSCREPWVLYALQMQPEANIDVFGAPWNDQAEIIGRAARALAKQGAFLVVKPNPKSKYEINSDLNDVVQSGGNIIPLPHATPMSEVFSDAPLVLSVTGTILLECIFSGKPAACLGSNTMSQYPGVVAIEKPETIGRLLESVLSNALPTATEEDARNLLQVLHSSSYPAQILDPISHPQFPSEQQLLDLTSAFIDVLQIVYPKRQLGR
jgi:hypothetical protein